MSTKKIPYVDRTLHETVPELLPYLRPGFSVLDIGCGPGTITLGVAEVVHPGEVVGIDINEERLQKATEMASDKGLKTVTFQAMDTHILDFPDNTFDVVFSHTALHAFRDPLAVLKEQKRVAKPGGWVIAAGVRDWGFIPRYPPTPTWDSLYDTWARYEDFRREHSELGEPLFLTAGHKHSARRCSEWFTSAGLEDLTMQVKVYRVQYPGSDEMKPHPIDLLPYGEENEYGWYAAIDNVLDAMIAEGFLDRETLRQATDEARAWYADPRAFHFWVMVFAAGKA